MKKFILFLSSCLFLITNAHAQCSANFVFTVNPNGNVVFANASTGFINSNHLWSFGDGQYSTSVFGPTHTYAYSGTYTVTLALNDILNNCNSSITQTLTVSNVSCNIQATPFISNVSNGYLNIKYSSIGTFSGTTYSLSYGDGANNVFINDSLNSTSHTYTSSGIYTVNLTAANSQTCYSNAWTSINITVPPCNLNANFTHTVNNGIVDFSNTTTGGSSVSTYTWDFGGTNSLLMTNPMPQTYLYNGQYTVSLTARDSASFNCYSTITQTINITTLPCSVNTSFTLSKDTTVIPAIVWNAYPIYPANISSVIWDWGDNTTTSALYPSHTYSNAGMYNVCVTVSVSCGSFTTICINSSIYKTSELNNVIAVLNVIEQKTLTTTDLNKIQNGSEFLLFPNPATNQITLEGIPINEKVFISDLIGNCVFSEIITQNKLVIDISNFPTGFYMIKISDSNATRKLLKEH